MRSVSPSLTRFVALVRETTGNIVPPSRHAFLEELLERRVRATGQPDLDSYVQCLAVGEMDREWGQLIPLITIKESYFFRAPQQFEALRRHLLPHLVRERSTQRRLRIWSAACARGEEPATLAMVLEESGLLGGWEWGIVATDVDEEALGAAEHGIYGERAVAQVPPALLDRCFTRRGKLFELSSPLKARIRFRPLNLARSPYRLPEDAFDLIFLRNVLIYFPRPLQRRVVAQAIQLLAPGGYLFLGASETLWQIHEHLRPLDLGACFCYHHPVPGHEPPMPMWRPRPIPAPVPLVPPSPSPAPAPAPPAPEPEAAPQGEPEEAWEELFDEEVDAGPSAAPALEPCAIQQRLAEAAQELSGNRLEEAARVLEEVMAADPSEPAAHALEGFLHDLQGMVEEAVGAYRAALYLDPALYQARLLLADCLLRLGHDGRARQQYREVLSTLSSGRERDLVALEDLPLPGRLRIERRCRQVLRGG